MGSLSAFILRKVATLTGGSDIPRCSSCVYMVFLERLSQCRGHGVEEVATARRALYLLKQLFVIGVVIHRVNL